MKKSGYTVPANSNLILFNPQTNFYKSSKRPQDAYLKPNPKMATLILHLYPSPPKKYTEQKILRKTKI